MSHKILIVRQSHTAAVSAAAEASDHIEVINLNSQDKGVSLKKKIEMGGYLPERADFRLGASMIGGNFHNTFGLIESSIPFDFIDIGVLEASIQKLRVMITYDLLYHYFNTAMRRGFLRSIVELRDYCGEKFVHIISPPSIGDARHIADNPGGYFSDKIHLGIAPASLRGKLYRLHTRGVVEFCRENGIPTLPAPPEAVTEDGFLARPFWKNDPTHANATYGRLVLEQLRGHHA